MDVKQPLIIFGTGRCGSTVFHQVLSYHPSVTWLSSWCLKYPSRPARNRLAMRLLDLPLPSRAMRKAIRTGEHYPFWDYHVKGFSDTCRDLTSADALASTKTILPRIFGQMLSPTRDRLLIKITGWPRVGFLKEIFPDAKFIHIYRDGRSVATSWLHMWWWDGWRGPHNWRWGELSPDQYARWCRHERSFVVLAGLGWEILMKAAEQARRSLPADDLLEIRYEDLCRDHPRYFKMAADFAGLAWTPGFEATVQRYTLESANDQWRKDLTADQQAALTDALRETLARYGYV